MDHIIEHPILAEIIYRDSKIMPIGNSGVWRVHMAILKPFPQRGDVLPYNNYPMKIDTGQVFVIDYIKTDNTSIRKFYRLDGKFWNNRPVTEEFKAE